MPVPKKQPITSIPEGSTSECSPTSMPEQEEFRQHLRRLAVSAVQALIEQIMLEELEQCVGRNYPRPPRLSQWVLQPQSGHLNRAH
jgi:putative transposase